MERGVMVAGSVRVGGHPIGTLTSYAVFSLTCFTLLRLGMMAWAWDDIAHGLGDLVFILGVGLVHDLAFVSYASLPFAVAMCLLPRKIPGTLSRWLSYTMVFVCSALLWFIVAAEVVFWDEFGTRFNFIAVDYLVYTTEVLGNIRESYPLGLILTGIGVLAFLTTWFFRGAVNRGAQQTDGRARTSVAGVCLVGSCLAYSLVTPSLRDNAVNNFAAELACNGPYQFVQAFKHSSLDYDKFFSLGDDNELSMLLKSNLGVSTQGGGDYHILHREEALPLATKPNLILISVESLSAEFLGRFGASRGAITPFMDSWFKEGLLFTQCYATGTRTTRGLDAITLSMPPLPGCAIVKRPDNARLFTLGKVLQDQGYDTAYLYGGRGYFDNMNAFFSGNGYRIVDQTSVPSERIGFANVWGMSDEDLYEETLHEASKAHETGRPFFFHVMTTSNHRPYTYPEGKVDIPSGEGRSGAVKYTDYALGRFVELARTLPWFENTLIVLVADHCASSAGKTGIPMNKYHIPLFVFGQKFVRSGEVSKVCSQIDIAPTVLRIMGLSYDSWFFGGDVLSAGFRERAFVSTYQKLGYYRNGRMAILSPLKKIEWVTDPLEGGGSISQGSFGDPLVKEGMSFYQGANRIFTQRLNRW
ncbi:MAG: LTA synthase family protein [Planctomycetota bacterium]